MNNELILTDAQGTPAGYGDTVQYILDKLGSEAFGPDAFPVSGLSSAYPSSFSINERVVEMTASSGHIAAGTVDLAPGALIEIRYTIESYTEGALEIRLSGDTLERNTSVDVSVGKHRLFLVAPSGDVDFGLRAGGTTTLTVVVDSIRELKGNHALQTNSSLKPVRGRVPVGGRRNLLPSTNLDGWGTNSISVSGYQDPKYPSAITLTDTADSGDTWHFVFARVFPTDGSAFCGRFLAKAGTLSKIGFRTRYISDSSEIAVIDLMTGNLSGSVAVMGEVIFETSLLANGWVEIKFTAASGQSDSRYDAFGLVLVSDSADGTYSSNLYIGDGNGTVHIAQPQGELGVEHAEFQRVTSNLDIYEPGAQHTEYLRFDHVDDKMAQTFPDGFTGDLVVCGTEGSWVDKDVTVAAGNDLTIGPKNLPNTAGILPALGDIIGWVPVGKSLTSAEQRAIVDYYKGRGAKGRLVPSGVELVTNGTFDTDVIGWTASTYTGFSISSVNGQLRMEGGDPAGTSYGASQAIAFEEGRLYKIDFDLLSAPINRYVRLLDGSGALIEAFAVGSNTKIGKNSFVLRAPTNAAGIAFEVFRDGVAVWDNISIQELIPEEDLA